MSVSLRGLGRILSSPSVARCINGTVSRQFGSATIVSLKGRRGHNLSRREERRLKSRIIVQKRNRGLSPPRSLLQATKVIQVNRPHQQAVGTPTNAGMTKAKPNPARQARARENAQSPIQTKPKRKAVARLSASEILKILHVNRPDSLSVYHMDTGSELSSYMVSTCIFCAIAVHMM